MSLVKTSKSISAVTGVLRDRITARTGVNVTIGRPEQSKGTGHNLNLFLYEIAFDPFLKNTPLDEGQKPPLWLVLKYLLTPFDSTGESDSAEAHADLGAAIRAVGENDLLKLDGLSAGFLEALGSNPEELQVTFDESPADLLAKLMQGSDEKLRLSIAFQVRPVMIAPAEPAEYSLLVGVDYTKTPPANTKDYIDIDVIPSLGATLDEIEPTGFEIGEEITLRGNDLHLSNLSVLLGNVELPITMQQPDKIKFKVDENFANGTTISAGSQPITAVQTLPSGKRRKSNIIVGNLVPTVSSASIISKTVPAVPPNSIFATVEISGVLLGNASDDVVLALYRDGAVVKMFDELEIPAGEPPQTKRRLVMAAKDAVSQGEYLLILRVNGQQATRSPKINLVP